MYLKRSNQQNFASLYIIENAPRLPKIFACFFDCLLIAQIKVQYSYEYKLKFSIIEVKKFLKISLIKTINY